MTKHFDQRGYTAQLPNDSIMTRNDDYDQTMSSREPLVSRVLQHSKLRLQWFFFRNDAMDDGTKTILPHHIRHDPIPSSQTLARIRGSFGVPRDRVKPHLKATKTSTHMSHYLNHKVGRGIECKHRPSCKVRITLSQSTMTKNSSRLRRSVNNSGRLEKFKRQTTLYVKYSSWCK